MQHIVFVTPDMEIGGVQQSLLTLLQIFPSDKIRLSLLLFSKSGELLSQLPPQVDILEAKEAGRMERLRKNISETLRRMNADWLFILVKSIYHKFGGKICRAKLTDASYDVAVAYNDGHATWYTAKRINATRKIAFVHTDFRSADYKAQNEREIYRQYDYICFASEASRESFLTLLPEFELKTLIIPNIVDKERIRTLASIGEKLPDGTGAIRLLTVGRVSREKGLTKVPELLHILKESGYSVVWYIVGDGPERENLISISEAYGVADNLILLGQRANPYSLMASCDVYVQPSDYEGYCLALAEARTLYRPILACDFSGAREQIRDGVTGFITGMKPEDILPKLKCLLNDCELRNSFSTALREEDRTNKSDVLWDRIGSIFDIN